MQSNIFWFTFLGLFSLISAMVLNRKERVNELSVYIKSQLTNQKQQNDKSLYQLIKSKSERKLQKYIMDEDKTKLLLQRARVSYSVTDYYLIRIISAGLVLVISFITLALFSSLSLIQAGIFTIFLTYSGFILPKFLVLGKARKRQRLAAKEVLSYARFLAIITSAGGDILNAIKRMSKYGNGVLAEEFSISLQEISSGIRKAQALLNMAKRLDVKDLTLMIEAIIEAERTGAPLARILRDQAKRINESIRNNAIEQAGKASVKLLGPVLLCIFPALLIIMFGPVAIQFSGIF